MGGFATQAPDVALEPTRTMRHDRSVPQHPDESCATRLALLRAPETIPSRLRLLAGANPGTLIRSNRACTSGTAKLRPSRSWATRNHASGRVRLHPSRHGVRVRHTSTDWVAPITFTTQSAVRHIQSISARIAPTAVSHPVDPDSAAQRSPSLPMLHQRRLGTCLGRPAQFRRRRGRKPLGLHR